MSGNIDDKYAHIPAQTYAHLQAPGAAGSLLSIVTPVIEDLGFELVRIRMTGHAGDKVAQVMAVMPDGRMDIEGCAIVSRALSVILDVEDSIEGTYHLEVSSPGMARPLCRPKDFDDWAGLEAKIELKNPIEGQKRFRGRLCGFENDEVLLEVVPAGFETPQILGFHLQDIAESRLVADEQTLQAGADAKKNWQENALQESALKA